MYAAVDSARNKKNVRPYDRTESCTLLGLPKSPNLQHAVTSYHLWEIIRQICVKLIANADRSFLHELAHGRFDASSHRFSKVWWFHQWVEIAVFFLFTSYNVSAFLSGSYTKYSLCFVVDVAPRRSASPMSRWDVLRDSEESGSNAYTSWPAA